ncbi:glycosyltransferase [Segnochrobactrum spirostomi]|uniref:Glycosyltransferase family 4 protein n=1 Tax=Segnochrobactrum spirostomi TaxID=2608987 RepID=A0A6A7XYM2_9HYPH|nr:glycosyltransferase [Segnochrobactrum spirostomi]MQT11396.1 glycosyltransferase family 4 protein [Segnochrobactrum spirostomi]
MRVLAVAERFVPAPGGSEISLHAVLRRLALAGHDTAIYTRPKPHLGEPWLERIEVAAFEADAFSAEIARRRPDRILTQMDWSHLCGPIAVAAGIPVCFFSCVGDLCGHFDGIVFNSRWNAETLTAAYPFLLGKARHLLHPLIEPDRVRAQAPAPSHVAMVNPIRAKGGHLFSRLVAANPDIPFLAVRGWYAPEEDGVALDLPNLSLLPTLSDMRRFYASARIVLVPSLFPEAFGRVAREAVLNGLPVIASTRGGLIDATWGAAIHLDPEDDAAWNATLRRLWQDEAAAEVLAARARAAAVTFDAGADFAAFLDFLFALRPQGDYLRDFDGFHNLEWLSPVRTSHGA